MRSALTNTYSARHNGLATHSTHNSPDDIQQPSFESVRPSTSTMNDSNSHLGLNDDILLASRLSNSFVPYQDPMPKIDSTHADHSRKRKSIFAISRKKKQDSLFPLPIRISPPSSLSGTPSASQINSKATSFDVPCNDRSTRPGASLNGQRVSPLDETTSFPTTNPISAQATTFAMPASIGRQSSSASIRSAKSQPAMPRYPSKNTRSRTGTMNSLGNERIPPSYGDSGRTSTASTTLGRNSIAGLRSLTSRLRNPSDPHSPRRGSPGSFAPGTSQQNSFAMSRETLVVPEREDGETSGKYYSRLEESIPKKSIAMVLSKRADVFSHDTMRSLMRTFKFYEEPLDMSIRRFLWEIDLPGEAQQIDRVIEAFSERYHECNPHIFNSPDEAYLIAYSIIILHSDLFNKNNKHKMQRDQYQKNTRGHGIPDEVLGYFYDNIQYTEFIAQNADADDAEKKSKAASRKVKKLKARVGANEAVKSGRLDPYELIIDDKLKLDILKPSLKEELNLEDTYNAFGSAGRIDIPSLRAAFSRFGNLQLMSARSRPDAFTSPSTITNPTEAHPGVVDIKVAKVGILWRKDVKKKKTRSPWQEWGAILTQSQLFFFRNAGWVKGLVNQAETHQKQGNRGVAVTFKPPLEEFDWDVKVATSDAIALQDTSYKRHKYAFVLARRGNQTNENPQERYFEETLLADNEGEMNDWLTKLNYAAAFKSTNIRMQSWQPSSARRQSTAGLPKGASRSPSRQLSSSTDTTNKDDMLKEAQNMRRELANQRLVVSDTNILEKTKQLEDLLRSARHLEILAPFPPKTRSELLAYGARIAHNIKWARYDLAKLRCQKDILIRDLDEDENGPKDTSLATPLPIPRHGLMSRLNSKASIGLSRTPHTFKGSSRRSVPSWVGSNDDNELIAGIDKAFATPLDTLSRANTSTDGPPQLAPLNLDSSTGTNGLDHLIGTNPSEARDSIRRNSMTSTRSDERPENDSGEESEFPQPEEVMQDEAKRPSSALESEMERIPRHSKTSSPGSGDRSVVRRSLQRTLRDSGSQSYRSRRNKENSLAVNSDDGSSMKDGEGISRRPGSFTVHGKKASVITFGSEWAQISPDERLRLRRQEKEEKSLILGGSIDGEDEGDYETPKERLSPHLMSKRSVTDDSDVDERPMTGA